MQFLQSKPGLYCPVDVKKYFANRCMHVTYAACVCELQVFDASLAFGVQLSTSTLLKHHSVHRGYAMNEQNTNLWDEQQEIEILERIVDAMLASQDELRDTGGERWSRILRDACREQKWQDQDEPSELLAVC